MCAMCMLLATISCFAQKVVSQLLVTWQIHKPYAISMGVECNILGSVMLWRGGRLLLPENYGEENMLSQKQNSHSLSSKCKKNEGMEKGAYS